MADAGNVVMVDNRQEGLAILWGVSPGMDPVLDSEIEADGGLAQGLKELDRVGEEVTGLGEALVDLQEALERLRETIGGASQ